jgi:hypothetical protein
MMHLAEAAVDNADKIIAGSIVVGAIAGAGGAVIAKETIDQKFNEEARIKYERSVGEIEERRDRFVNADASEQILEIFDEQNPRPDQPADRSLTKLHKAAFSALGGVAGLSGGWVLGEALVLGACGSGIAGYRISSPERKKEADEAEIEEAR